MLPEMGRNAARTVAYPGYVHEILAHAGICYAAAPWDELPEKLDGLRILVTVGEAALPEGLQQRLREWVEAGGAWLAVAGVCGMEELFGVRVEQPAYSTWGGGLCTLGEGYVRPGGGGALMDHVQYPLHYFNGLPVQAVGASTLATCLDAHGRETERSAITERDVGPGYCLLIAPDVTGAVVRIQQGIAVTRDGVPAGDGTAPVNDAVLKSDDGAVLDWILDREPVPGVPGFRAFLQPIADQWRELLIRAILHTARRQKVPLPVLWYYPRNLPALGHLSHDTDGNEPDPAYALLDHEQKLEVKSTWCVILPGYDGGLIRSIGRHGHELALHYDAMTDGCPWSEEEFDRQWRLLTELFGERPTSNKNHYLRWEGDTELWEWCCERGIQLDQSKGASKTGEAGFNFGTCHPYFPVAREGALLDVLELPTPTQDLGVFAPPELLDPLLGAVTRHHGVLHLLFHPAHVTKPAVAAALIDAVERGRKAGLEWWTAAEINHWERARRQVEWLGYECADGTVHVRLRCGVPFSEATILWLAGDGEADTVCRWGVPFRAHPFDAGAGEVVEISSEGTA